MASFNANTQNWCPCCGKAKAKSNFVKSLTNKNNILPYCKTCINAKLRKYKEKTKSDGAALYCLCAELGYPVIKEVYDIAIKIYLGKNESLKNSNLFTIYCSALQDIGLVVEGFWQSDMDLSQFITDGNLKVEKEKVLDLKKLERTWGKFGKDEYELLESFYEMYTKNIPEMNTGMELRYRDLCKAELRKRKADESGDITEITKAEDSLRKNMGLLKLDNFDDGKKSDVDRFIDRLVWKIEETEPAEEEDKSAYRDIQGFEKIYNDWMRSMQNMCAGTKNYPKVPKAEM